MFIEYIPYIYTLIKYTPFPWKFRREEKYMLANLLFFAKMNDINQLNFLLNIINNETV